MITFRELKLTPAHPDMAWLREHVRCVLCEDTRGLVAERDGAIVGMYVLDSWSENSVQVHQAMTDPLVFKHGFHVELAQYVFGTSGRKMIIGLTPSDNAKAIKLNKHYGFTEHCRVKDAYADGVDYIIMRMTAAECNYYQETADAA